jgi:phosphoribosylformimino-5-aminoimidazole carboxamide ribotide isomerase
VTKPAPHGGAEVTLYPAIDILDGKAVRLSQGDFQRETVYADDPLEAARRWVAEGARALHVIDLDGARSGRPVALTHLRRVAEVVGVPIQYGGGLRALEHVREALEAGAQRAVLGTAAFTDEALLDRALEQLGERIAVAVDVRDGRVATSGWTGTTQIGGEEAVLALRRRGVETIVYTDVDRDGMLSGPDLSAVSRVSRAVGDATFVYSGGVGSLSDLRALTALRLSNLGGVIVGKALFEGRFTVAEALTALAGGSGREAGARSALR